MSNDDNDEYIKTKRKIAGYGYVEGDSDLNDVVNDISSKQGGEYHETWKVSKSSPSSPSNIKTSNSWTWNTSPPKEDELSRVKRKIASMEQSDEEDKKKLPPKVPNNDMARIKKRIANLSIDDEILVTTSSSSSQRNLPPLGRIRSSNSIDAKRSDSCEDILELKHKIATLSSDDDQSTSRGRALSHDDDFRRMKHKIAGISNQEEGRNRSSTWSIPANDVHSFSSKTSEDHSTSFFDDSFLETSFRATKQEINTKHGSWNNEQLSQPSNDNVNVRPPSPQRQRPTAQPGAYAISSRGDVNARQMPQKTSLPESSSNALPPSLPLIPQSESPALEQQQSLDDELYDPTASLHDDGDNIKPKCHHSRRKMVFLVAMSSTILVVVILLSTLLKPPCCTPPNNPNNINYTQRYDDALLSLSNMSNPILFQMENTSQFKALNWIVYNDTSTNTSLVQRYILALFYYATNGPIAWFVTNNWLSSQSECNWYGIKCNDTFVRTNISSIFMVNNGIQNSIPSELFQLSNVVGINLSWNRITGTLHSNIGLLQNIRFLELNNNILSGNIPLVLFTLPFVKEINLEQNSFSGPLFQDNNTLEYSTSLNYISLSGNQLTGSIPSIIRNFHNLVQLVLDRNSLTGSIPHDIKYLTFLKDLSVTTNRMTGSIPNAVCFFPMTGLHLSFNTFSGEIPDCIGNLTSLGKFFPDIFIFVELLILS